MYKLFVLAHKRFLKKSFLLQQIPISLTNQINKLNLNTFSNHIYFRFPRDQIKNLLKFHCPTHQPNNQEQLVQSSKRLRAFFSVSQMKVCDACPNNKKCKLVNLPFTQKKDTAIEDLSNFYNAIAKNGHDSMNYRGLVSAFKTVDILSEIVEDLKNGGNQMKIFQQQRLKEEQRRNKQIQRIVLTMTEQKQKKKGYRVNDYQRKQQKQNNFNKQQKKIQTNKGEQRQIKNESNIKSSIKTKSQFEKKSQQQSLEQVQEFGLDEEELDVNTSKKQKKQNRETTTNTNFKQREQRMDRQPRNDRFKKQFNNDRQFSNKNSNDKFQRARNHHKFQQADRSFGKPRQQGRNSFERSDRRSSFNRDQRSQTRGRQEGYRGNNKYSQPQYNKNSFSKQNYIKSNFQRGNSNFERRDNNNQRYPRRQNRDRYDSDRKSDNRYQPKKYNDRENRYNGRRDQNRFTERKNDTGVKYQNREDRPQRQFIRQDRNEGIEKIDRNPEKQRNYKSIQDLYKTLDKQPVKKNQKRQEEKRSNINNESTERKGGRKISRRPVG